MSDQRRASAVTPSSQASTSEAGAPECAPLEAQFEAAVRVIRGLPKEGPYKPSHELQLKFYSFFKQATEGPCTGNRPKMWEPVKRAKWDAWNTLGQMPRDEAMRAYIKELLAIVETMSFTDNVAEFLASMGPLVHFVNLEKVVGEDAARDYIGCASSSNSNSADVVEPIQPVRSSAPSVCSHKSSSETFFSQEEFVSGDDDPEDGWSTPALEDTSNDESNEDEGTNGNGNVAVARPLVRVKPKSKRSSGGQQQSKVLTTVQPCVCKEILENMRRDLLELTERVKLVESTLHQQPRTVSPSRPKDVAVSMEHSGAERFSGDKSALSLVLFKLRLVLRACWKVFSAKPNYAVVFLWPVLLQAAVLFVVRFYYFKF